MAISQHMVSSFFPEKSSGSLAFISAGLAVVLATSMSGCSGVGRKGSSSALVISILRSGMGTLAGSGRVEMVIGRESSAAGNSCHGRTFESLMTLCILLSVLSPDGLPVPWQLNPEPIW